MASRRYFWESSEQRGGEHASKHQNSADEQWPAPMKLRADKEQNQADEQGDDRATRGEQH